MKKAIPIIVMFVMVVIVVAGWWYMKSLFSAVVLDTEAATTPTKVIKPASVSKITEEITAELQNLNSYGTVPVTTTNIPRASSFPLNSSTINQ